jgi:hypothetical protein
MTSHAASCNRDRSARQPEMAGETARHTTQCVRTPRVTASRAGTVVALRASCAQSTKVSSKALRAREVSE